MSSNQYYRPSLTRRRRYLMSEWWKWRGNKSMSRHPPSETNEKWNRSLSCRILFFILSPQRRKERKEKRWNLLHLLLCSNRRSFDFPFRHFHLSFFSSSTSNVKRFHFPFILSSRHRDYSTSNNNIFQFIRTDFLHLADDNWIEAELKYLKSQRKKPFESTFSHDHANTS